MAPTTTSTALSSLTNPLVTSQQLLTFRNASAANTQSQNFAQSLLTNSAGILLRLPQEVIATSLVLLQRYQVASGQAHITPSKFDSKTISAAIVYLSAKISFTPLSPRSVINVYAYLTSSASSLWFVNSKRDSEGVDPKSYYVSEGMYEREKLRLFEAEAHALVQLGFDTHVVLPHQLALTYIQALGVTSSKLAHRTLEHLNGGLLSPQMIYLTHQANALAVAAIYLAAREVEVKLVQENWWEVFDVEREDLGFLVLAFGSLANFAMAEQAQLTKSDDNASLFS